MEHRFPWRHTGRACSTDVACGEGGSVQKGFLETMVSEQKPQGEAESEEEGVLFRTRGEARTKAERQERAGDHSYW